MKDADQPIVQAFLAGEPAQVEEVTSWIRQVLRGYSSNLAVGRQTTVEDLTQEVLLEVIRALRFGRFRGDGSLPAFVSRIAHHRAIDALRRRRENDWLDPADLNLPSNLPRIDATLVGRDRLLELVRLFQEMPDHCQKLWRLIVAGKSYREMAEIEGVNEGTLRVRVLRCRKKAAEARSRVLSETPSEAMNDEDQE